LLKNKINKYGSTSSSRSASQEEKFQGILFGIPNDISGCVSWFYCREYPGKIK
jgi:hypothetical protein